MPAKVLIVEDEVDVAKLLSILLEENGHDVSTVASGEEVAGFLENNIVDIILLDIILPNIDGYEVCKRVKTHRKTNIIPIIMLTARVFPEDVIKGFGVGADKYITKPFEGNALLNEIENQLKKSAEIKNIRVTDKISLNIDSDVEYIVQINDMVKSLFLSTPIKEKDINEIRKALLDVCKSVIEWNGKDDNKQQVCVCYELKEERFVITISDLDAKIDFKDYGEHESYDKRYRGLGILLAKTLMSDIEYNEKGNEVTLSKFFDNESIV